MSFLDVLSLSKQCLSPERKDRDRNKKGPMKVLTSFHLAAQPPSLCFYYKANLLCGLSLLRLRRKEWPS